jgi:hypothetical protein
MSEIERGAFSRTQSSRDIYLSYEQMQLALPHSINKCDNIYLLLQLQLLYYKENSIDVNALGIIGQIQLNHSPKICVSFISVQSSRTDWL